jgi:hypothetical protein
VEAQERMMVEDRIIIAMELLHIRMTVGTLGITVTDHLLILTTVGILGTIADRRFKVTGSSSLLPVTNVTK